MESNTIYLKNYPQRIFMITLASVLKSVDVRIDYFLFKVKAFMNTVFCKSKKGVGFCLKVACLSFKGGPSKQQQGPLKV